MTEFRDIPGYEGYYQAGDDGTIRSVDKIVRQHSGATQKKRGKVLRPAVDKIGYIKVALSKNNKLMSYPVHRLVALAFIPNPNNLKEVNHKDCIKSNNHVSNLEWCDRLHNMRHAYANNLVPIKSGDENWATKIKQREKPIIKSLRNRGIAVKDIAKKYDCSVDVIYRALK